MFIENTSPKLGLQYNEANSFFDDSIEFLQSISFVSILSIDMHVKYSFQKTSRETIVQGAEIDTYDNNHLIDDTFFVYKITIPRETSITRSLLYITFNKQKSSSIKSSISFIKSIPIVGLLILALFFKFIPWKIGDILQSINLIAIFIILLFYGYKYLCYSLQQIKAKNKTLNDHMVSYINPHDLNLFTPEVKEGLNNLSNLGVTNLAIDRNTLYFKQDLINNEEGGIISEILGRRKIFSEEKKERIMTDMIDMLSDPKFLSMFFEKNEEQD